MYISCVPFHRFIVSLDYRDHRLFTFRNNQRPFRSTVAQFSCVILHKRHFVQIIIRRILRRLVTILNAYSMCLRHIVFTTFFSGVVRNRYNTVKLFSRNIYKINIYLFLVFQNLTRLP